MFGPSEPFYLQVPFPIQRTKNLTLLQKDVWSIVYTWQRLGWRNLTVKRLTEMTGSDRTNIWRAAKALRDKGMLAWTKKKKDGMALIDFRVQWPEWIQVETRAIDLPRETRLRLAADEANGGSVTQPPSRGANAPSRGSATQPLEGSHHATPSGGSAMHPPVRGLLKEDREESSCADPAGLHIDPESSGETVTGGDDSSKTLREQHATQQEQKATRRAPASSGKRSRRSASGPELLRTPSERWEFCQWQTRRTSYGRWTAQDLIGYWTHRYLEKAGTEDPDLFIANLRATPYVILRRNVQTCVKLFFDSSYRRAVEAVDKIFERAPRDKWVLRYYFTPSNESTLRSLDRQRAHSGYRGQAPPHVLDDASGSNRDRWDQLAAEANKTFRSTETGIDDERSTNDE